LLNPAGWSGADRPRNGAVCFTTREKVRLSMKTMKTRLNGGLRVPTVRVGDGCRVRG
jgi:hypothetical protein